MNFAPYRRKFEKLIGKKVDSLELYPASEGFIAFQDTLNEKGLLLLLDYGIFYEFIPVGKDQEYIVEIQDVKLFVEYELVITTNGGLWR